MFSDSWDFNSSIVFELNGPHRIIYLDAWSPVVERIRRSGPCCSRYVTLGRLWGIKSSCYSQIVPSVSWLLSQHVHSQLYCNIMTICLLSWGLGLTLKLSSLNSKIYKLSWSWCLSNAIGKSLLFTFWNLSQE